MAKSSHHSFVYGTTSQFILFTLWLLINPMNAQYAYCGYTYSGYTSYYGQIKRYNIPMSSSYSSITVSACGSSYDTMLLFYDPRGYTLTLNDNSYYCSDNSRSQFTYTPTGGFESGTYQIGVGAFGDENGYNYGYYRITITCTQSSPTPRPPSPISNCYGYPCANGYGCYSSYDKCDGYDDCYDGSDEWGCSSTSSTEDSPGISGGGLAAIIIVGLCILKVIIGLWCAYGKKRKVANKHKVHNAIQSTSRGKPKSTRNGDGEYRSENTCLVNVQGKLKNIDKEVLIKTSKTKKNHYDKFPTLKRYSMMSRSDNKKATQLTQRILAKTPSGDVSDRDTLLHILNSAATANGKQCIFYDSSKGIKPENDIQENVYLNVIQNEQFVLVLSSFDQFVDEQKYDQVEKLREVKKALVNNENHPVMYGVRSTLATAHGVSIQRVIIMDIYINGPAFVYKVTDLTDLEKNKIINGSPQFRAKMQQLFNDYEKCAIHPALLHNSYDISMFDARGDKQFDSGSTYKIGPLGREREYKQPTGWTRYGLKVLDKYPGGNKWLKPFEDKGNWYRAYHGTTRDAGSKIINTAMRPGSNNVYGIGIYCSPDVNIAAGYCRQKIILRTKKGPKSFYFVFQVAVNPDTMNNPQYIKKFNPACESINYWIAPTGADIRPYGILIKEV